MRPCAIRLLTRAICRGSDYQRVEILGQDLTSLFQDLWKKSVVTDTKDGIYMVGDYRRVRPPSPTWPPRPVPPPL